MLAVIVTSRLGRAGSARRRHEDLVGQVGEAAAQPRGQVDEDGAVASDHAQHDELVAAEAGDGVARRARSRAEPAGHLDEQLVAGGVAERVVDDLEAVEVDEEDDDVFASAVGPGERLAQPVEQERAVGQPGERVVEGVVGEACVPTGGAR